MYVLPFSRPHLSSFGYIYTFCVLAIPHRGSRPIKRSHCAYIRGHLGTHVANNTCNFQSFWRYRLRQICVTYEAPLHTHTHTQTPTPLCRVSRSSACQHCTISSIYYMYICVKILSKVILPAIVTKREKRLPPPILYIYAILYLHNMYGAPRAVSAHRCPFNRIPHLAYIPPIMLYTMYLFNIKYGFFFQYTMRNCVELNIRKYTNIFEHSTYLEKKKGEHFEVEKSGCVVEIFQYCLKCVKIFHILNSVSRKNL